MVRITTILFVAAMLMGCTGARVSSTQVADVPDGFRPVPRTVYQPPRSRSAAVPPPRETRVPSRVNAVPTSPTWVPPAPRTAVPVPQLPGCDDG